MRRAVVIAHHGITLRSEFGRVCPSCAKRGVLVVTSLPGNVLPLPKPRTAEKRVRVRKRGAFVASVLAEPDPRQGELFSLPGDPKGSFRMRT